MVLHTKEHPETTGMALSRGKIYAISVRTIVKDSNIPSSIKCKSTTYHHLGMYNSNIYAAFGL